MRGVAAGVQQRVERGGLGTAQADEPGAVRVLVDPLGAGSTQTFWLTAGLNDPPAILSTPVETVTAETSYRYDVWAVDPNADPLDYVLDNAPAGMTIDALGRVTWLPVGFAGAR